MCAVKGPPSRCVNIKHHAFAVAEVLLKCRLYKKQHKTEIRQTSKTHATCLIKQLHTRIGTMVH